MTADHRSKLSGGRLAAALVAALMVTAVLGPVGLASAQTVSISQTVQGGDTTVAPGDTVTIEVTFDYADVNGPGIDATPPSGWTVTSHTDDGGTYGPPQPAWIWAEGGENGASGSHTVTYTVEVPSDASPGQYTFSVEGSGINPADSSFVSDTDDLTVTVEDTSTGGDAVFAVNAGGSEEYTATDGTTFVADTNFDGGQTFTSGSAGTPSEPEIGNTDDDELYWTERYGDFSYNIPVPENGQYEVTLHFAELYQGVANDGGEGDRLFDVSAEGQLILDNYDIIAESGAPQTAITETTTVDVGDGELNLDFTTVEDNAKISAIEVTPVDDGQNTAPTIDPISDQTVTEGDSATVPVSASDDDGDSVSLSLSQSPEFVSLSNGEISIAPQSGDAADSPYTVEVTADDGTDTTTESFQVTVEEPTPAVGSALVEILPDSGNVDASTYGSGSYQVTNTGEKEIASVSFNLDTATLPDMVFDPAGTAGDPTGEGLNIVDEGGTGITTAGGGSAEAFSQPHNGQNDSDGYDVMTVEFDDFQSGETATFWADNDPTSIKGATVGSQEAGPVSGLELARATVTVTYADGTTQTTQLMGDGSTGGSTAVATDSEAPAPTIGADGVSLDGSVLDSYHSGATVSEASQTITVSGEPGETVTLVRVEGELALSNVPNGGYDIEDLEANNAVDVEYYTATLDSNGEATVPVTLTDSPDDDDDAGYNYFVAAQGEASGDMGLASNVVVLEYEPDQGIDTPIGEFENAPTDPDGDGLYEDVNGDGVVNVGDAQAIFANTDDPVVQNNPGAFDYNGDGGVNVGDAQALFANGLEAGDA